MEAISYTKARNKLSGLMEQVCQNHDPVIITRQQQASVVVMSLEDYNALTETAYLLQSPKNSKRLNDAVSDFRLGKNFKKVEI